MTKGSDERVAPTLLSDCIDRLEPDPMITDVLFTRFVIPRVEVEGPRGPQNVPAVLPRTFVDATAARAVADLAPESTWLEVQGGIAPFAEWNADDLHAPIAQSVSVDDVDTVIAARHVEVDRLQWSVSMTPADIDALLAGAPAVVTATTAAGEGDASRTGFLRLVPTDAPDRAARGPVMIRELLEFLNEPRLPSGPGGEPGERLKLSAEQVRALRVDGRTSVTAGVRELELVVDDGESDATDGAAGPVASWADDRAPVSARADVARGATPVPPVWELAFALTWRQRWRLLGYMRGELLNTLSLAPQEETTLELFTWDRRRDESERSSSVEVDNNLEKSDTKRDTTDVLTETKNSSSFNWNVKGGLTLPATSALPLNIGGGAGGQQTWDGMSRTTTNHVHEATTNAATKVRLARQSKVTESREWGREQRVTRTVANPNMCRTLNLDYFEILSRYGVETSFDRDRAQLCALVASPLTPAFVRETVRRYESPLRRSLLDRGLEPGFDAVKLLAARARACAVACERCSCAGQGGAGGIGPLADAVVDILRSAAGAWRVIKEASAWPKPTGATTDARYRVIAASALRWAYTKAITAAAPGLVIELDNALAQVVNNYPIIRRNADAIWWALRNAGGVDALRPAKLWAERKADIEEAMRAVEGLPWGEPLARRLEWPFRDVVATGALDDFSLVTHLDRFAVAYDALPAAEALQEADNPPTGPTRSDLATEAVRDAYPLIDVAEAIEREEALLAHLSENSSYYWMALWEALSPSQQAASLTDLLPAGIVEPWPIGMVGTRLAFPIAGYRVPEVDALIDELFPETDDPGPSAVVSLPTPAITCEARLGACDGCEDFIRHTRRADLRTRDAEAARTEAVAAVEQAEADRRRARLDATPADLTDPNVPPSLPVIRVQLEES